MGHGLALMVSPTSVVLVGGLAIAKVGYDQYLRFVWPLLLALFVVSTAVIGLASPARGVVGNRYRSVPTSAPRACCPWHSRLSLETCPCPRMPLPDRPAAARRSGRRVAAGRWPGCCRLPAHGRGAGARDPAGARHHHRQARRRRHGGADRHGAGADRDQPVLPHRRPAGRAHGGRRRQRQARPADRPARPAERGERAAVGARPAGRRRMRSWSRRAATTRACATWWSRTRSRAPSTSRPRRCCSRPRRRC